MDRLQPYFVALALLFAAGPALAEEPTLKELFENGQIHYDSGQYDLALEAWEEAFRQSNRTILLIKMADAYEAMGDLDQAIELLETYRESAEDAELASITARVENLKARRATVTAPREPEPRPEPAPDPITPEPEPEPVVDRRPLALDLSLGGLTVGGLALGTGAGFAALAARNKAMENCAEAGGSVVCTGGASDALARDRSTSLLSDVGFAIGGVAGVAWTVSAIAIKPKSSEVAWMPTPNGAVISWTPR